MSCDYVVLYADKKPEDNIIINNMFKNNMQINIGWTEADFEKNIKFIESLIHESNIKQIIFSGLEYGWDKLISEIRKKYKDIKIKVICTTNDSLLYYEYERNNFFSLLDLSKKGVIDTIAFFRKSQFEMYSTLGYKCVHLLENYESKGNNFVKSGNSSEFSYIGVYPLNYTWDKNIFNQLCIPKFIDKSCINYNSLDPRMDEFLEAMKINHKTDNVESMNDASIMEKINKNDVIVATSFTDYVHPLFFLSMELGIPCLIGDNSDFFCEEDELKLYVVSSAEDNPIINSEKVKKLLKNKEKVKTLYSKWKIDYDMKSSKSIKQFLDV